MNTTNARDVDNYIAALPEGSRKILTELRNTIKSIVPDATEVISYQVPTFRYQGPLVAYAAFTNHCSFFPMSKAIIKAHEKELKDFGTSKGTVRFTADKPLPDSLVKKMVKARIKENEGGKWKSKSSRVSTGEKILSKHPLGKSGKNISRQNYETLKKSIISALRNKELTHTELLSQLNKSLKGKFSGNISWYAETVKLDLEARKIIKRTSSKPQKYQLK